MEHQRPPGCPDCAHRSCRCVADDLGASRRRWRPARTAERDDEWAPWIAAVAANA